jgi:uncharacterized membrane protein YcjF (UPF0283 family)
MATKAEQEVEKLNDIVRKLEILVQGEVARLDGSRKEIDKLAEEIAALRENTTKTAVIDQRLTTIEDAGRRRWSFWSSVVGGLIVGFLVIVGQIIGQLILNHFVKK